MEPQEEVLQRRLEVIRERLRTEKDAAQVEGLLVEQRELELKVMASRISGCNREAARRAQERSDRLISLRAEHGVLVARRANLEEQRRQAVAEAEAQAPTEGLRAAAWTLPHIRSIIGERDGVVAKITQVEKEIDELERPADKEAA